VSQKSEKILWKQLYDFINSVLQIMETGHHHPLFLSVTALTGTACISFTTTTITG